MTKMIDVHELKIFERNTKSLSYPKTKYVVLLNGTAYETNDFMVAVSWNNELNLDDHFYNAYNKIAEFYVNYGTLFENFENLVNSIKDKFPEILI